MLRQDRLRESPYPWLLFALGCALFAGLTAILGKLGVAGLNSNLAILIRTVVVYFVTALIVSLRDEWAMPKHVAVKPVTFLVLSGVATGLSWCATTARCSWRRPPSSRRSTG